MKKLITIYSVFFILPVLIFAVAIPVSAQTEPIMLQKQPPQQNPDRSKEELAKSYYQNQEYQKAAELFSQLYDKYPQQYYYMYYLNCLVEMKDYKEAEKLIKNQSNISNSNFRYIIDDAWLNKIMGNDRKSSKLLNQIIEQLPVENSLVVQIANALQARGFYEEALEVYVKARQLPGNNNSYNFEIANIYRFNGDYNSMYDALLDYLAANPSDMQRIKNQLQGLLRLDVDNNLGDILKTKLLEKTQANPDNLVFSEMLVWYAMQNEDFSLAFRQARSIDMRYNDHEITVMEVAEVALSNKDYATAVKAFEYVKNKKEQTPFYLQSYTGYYLAYVLQAEADPGTSIEVYKDLQKTGNHALDELGLNTQTLPIALNLAHITAFRLGEYQQAIQLLETTLAIVNISAENKAELKLELANILLATDKVWDASLLYSQIEGEMKNEPIGHEAKFRNAKLFYYVGEYSWAKTRLDILKSATSKLIANDAIELSLFINDIIQEDTTGFTLSEFGKADLLQYQLQYDSSLAWLNLIEQQVIGDNARQFVIYKKAEIYTQLQNYQVADSLYAYMVARFPESIKADNATFKQAELQRLQFKNNQKAMELYLFLMTNYPESIYSNEARVQYRALREDNLDVPN
ncbi:MAG TPA: tetratricopeptide repeat protein [Bacteroidales bacterium]